MSEFRGFVIEKTSVIRNSAEERFISMVPLLIPSKHASYLLQLFSFGRFLSTPVDLFTVEEMNR